MTCQPAFSHATQLIPVARKLSGDGHSVAVATSASFAPVLARHGIDVRAFGPDWMIGPGDPVYDRTVGRHLFPGFAQVPDRSSIDRVAGLARDHRADLIVREYSEFTGWVVARKLGVPLVTHGIIHRLRPPAEDGIAQAVGRLAELAGVDPPRDRDDLLGSAYLNIVPPSFRCPWEHDQPVGAGKWCHLRRPGRIRGSGPRAGRGAECAYRSLPPTDEPSLRAGSAAVSGAADGRCNDRRTRSGPAAGAVRR